MPVDPPAMSRQDTGNEKRASKRDYAQLASLREAARADVQLGQNEEVSVRTIDINRPANLAERKAGGCLFMVGGKPLRFLDRPGLA